jgi:DNA-binding winged helix-turn-helix (wHTH) protein/Tol biopolymer transport system component
MEQRASGQPAILALSPGNSSSLVLRFGPFKLVCGTNELSKDCQPVKLQHKQVEALKLLAIRPCELVPHEEFYQQLWPGNPPINVKQSLAFCITRIRRALDDHPKKPRYIETLRGQGYRFVGQVEAVQVADWPLAAPGAAESPLPRLSRDSAAPGSDSAEGSSAEPGHSSSPVFDLRSEGQRPRTHVPAPPESEPRRHWWRVGGLFLGVLFLAVLFLAVLVFAIPPIMLMVDRLQRNAAGGLPERLTTNSAEIPVTAARISADGKFLAYVDKQGIHIEPLGDKESRRIVQPPLPAVTALSWSPDGTQLLVSGRASNSYTSGVWTVSRLNGKMVHIRDNAAWAVASPDGAQMAFVSGNGKEIYLARADGEQPRLIFVGEEGDDFRDLSWFPDAPRLLFTNVHLGSFQLDIAIQSLDLNQMRATVLYSNPAVRGTCVYAGGRVVYALTEPPPKQNDVNLWEIRIDTQTGKLLNNPRRITDWGESLIYNLSATSNGERVVFLRGSYHADVYVGDLYEYGSALKNSQPVTFDDRNSFITAWTPDGGLLFHSDRENKWEIFRQYPGQPAEVVLSSANDERGARLSPDGRVILCFERPRSAPWSWVAPASLISFPFADKKPHVLLREYARYSFRCARLPSHLCVLARRRYSRLNFYVLDPESGEGLPLGESAIDSDQTNWDLSPDGSRLAIVLGDEKRAGHIRVFDLPSRSIRDVTINGWTGFQSIDWAAHGEGWYVSSRSADGAVLLYIDIEGRARVLRSQTGSFGTWGIPSPDGEHLAFLEWTIAATNVWDVNL